MLPHPALLGGRWSARLLDFRDPIAQERAIESLSLIDGVIQIGPARTALSAVYFVDSESQSERRLRQFRSIAGTKEVGPELSFRFAPCSRRMTRADWRMVLALRRTPEAGIAELAQDVGQSTRTTSRRFDSLVEDRAVMYDPILDFSHFHQTLAVIVASVPRPEMSDRVERQMQSLHPQSMRSLGPTPSDPERNGTQVSLWVTAPASAELDELLARVVRLDGVSDAYLWYGRSTIPVRAWLDEVIAGRLQRMGAVT